MRNNLQLLTIAAILLSAGLVPCRAEVELTPVAVSARWDGATEDGALKFACSQSPEDLVNFFARQELPFWEDLMRETKGAYCHVFYRPTITGFRATPDDDPLLKILIDGDPLPHLVTTPGNRGDPAGAMREVISRIRRQIDIDILMHRVHPQHAYDRSTRANFGKTPHRINMLDRGLDRTLLWVQDYVKSGRSSRGETILIPHAIFEGRPENKKIFEPLLDRISGWDRVVRSKLSWEGGDLQFARDPRDPRRLILFYGDFVKPYWGESLTRKEFEYVLSLEFGADQAIDLSGLAPHVDYFVSFLPSEKTVLVSVPRSGDFDVARSAVERLLERFRGNEPAALAALRRSLSPSKPRSGEVKQLVEQARRKQGDWAFEVDAGLPARVKLAVAEVCPDGGDCFDAAGQVRLAEGAPDVFAAWIYAVHEANDEQAIITAHLDLVESQLEPVPDAVSRRVLKKIAELERLKFRVVRVPAFRVNLSVARDWPGISYVNCLVVDDLIFMPRFGLGEVEDRIFRDITAQLPRNTVVPIYAQRVLIRNGGLHCLAGLLR